MQSNKSRRLDSHQHEAVYKTAAFLNRATSAFRKGVRGGIEPAAKAFTGQDHYTTDTVSSPGWIRTSDLSHVTGMSCPLPFNVEGGDCSTPTRIRTRNASFEARYDGPFHHRGVERKARESNSHPR